MAEKLKVSHSRVKLWRKCKHAYNYRYVQKLRKRIKAHALNVGIIFHDCIEAWALGKSYKPVLKKYDQEMKNLFQGEREEFQDAFDLAKGMVDGYTSYYEVDDYVAVELEVNIPLTDDIDYIGYIDALVNKDGGLWLMERKTCKNFLGDDFTSMDIQTVLYRWALPQMGYEVPRGIIWDMAKKKLPVQPQLLAKGGLSKNSKIDTTYELYSQAIEDNDLDPDDYSDMLEMLKTKENNFQRRVSLPFSKLMEDQVMKDFKETAIEIKILGETLTNRNLGRDCSWCDYKDLCHAELKGLDTNFIIKKDFTTKEQRDAKEKRDKEKVNKIKKSKSIRNRIKNKKG